MMHAKAKKGRVTLIIVGFTLALMLLSYAEHTEAVTVGPAKLEFNVQPGEVVTGQFFLMNEERDDKTYYSTFEKFTEKNGQREYLAGERTEVAYWLHSSTSVLLKPGEHQYIPFEIIIPSDAPPGGHYAVVWWSDAAPQNQTDSVSIVTRVGVLVYIRVAGDVKEVASLQAITSANRKWFGKLPVDFAVGVKNEGNVHVKPQGEVQIKNLFGKKRAVLPVNGSGRIILPLQSETFQAAWEPRFAFGPYQASVILSYGGTAEDSSRRELDQSAWIFVFPMENVLILVVLLLVLFVILPFAVRSYNSWIINQAFQAGAGSRHGSAARESARKKSKSSADSE